MTQAWQGKNPFYDAPPEPDTLLLAKTDKDKQLQEVQQVIKKTKGIVTTASIAQKGQFLREGHGTVYIDNCDIIWIGNINKVDKIIDFAVSLGFQEISAIRKIWLRDRLVYTSDSIDGNINLSKYWTDYNLYFGTMTQTADPRIVAKEGSDKVSGWRGLAYMVVKNYQLKMTQMKIPKFDVEVVCV